MKLLMSITSAHIGRNRHMTISHCRDKPHHYGSDRTLYSCPVYHMGNPDSYNFCSLFYFILFYFFNVL